MAFIPTNAAQVQQFAGALYGLTAGTQTMSYVLGEINKTSLDQVLNTYFTASFGKDTTASVAQRMVANLGIAGDAASVATTYVSGLLNAAPAAGRGAAVKDILATFSGLTSDATYGAAARAWTAKVDAALSYTGAVDIPMSPGTNPALPALTVTQDVLMGSKGDDVFVARVVQNSLGMQTNTLGTGDVLNGDAGTDALLADVVMASTLVSQPMSPIRPETKGIEFAHFNALEADQSQNNEVVMINAAKMLGLSRVGSVGSDASLTVYNLTTLTDSGKYEDRRNTKDMTVRMDHSGNDTAFSGDVESDMTVLFDQNYLIAGRTTTNFLEIRAVNNVALKKGDQSPLDGVLSVKFFVNGIKVTVPITEDILKTVNVKDAYTKLVAEINRTLDSTPGVPKSSAIAKLAESAGGVLITRQSDFSDDVVGLGYKRGERAGDYHPIIISTTAPNTILLKDTVDVSLSRPDANYLNTFVDTLPTSVINEPVTVQVELHKVGRGGDGGDLTIGGMSTDYNLLNSKDTNKWNAGTGAPGNFAGSAKQGIEVFNVTVIGDATQPSDLASLQSTNNALRTVNVSAATGAAAQLIIGNRETDAGSTPINGAVDANARDLTTFRNAGLKDVKDFNAASFNNGVELHSWISDESVAKYMNRTDRAPEQPAADNANFVYGFGSGNDTLNINISKANLAASGTTNREDFTFVARTGAGNDTVLAQIGDGQGQPSDIWYINHLGQRNISIDGGAGNDTVRTYGSSAWSIVAGEGDDLVYTDNSGAQGAANASLPTSIFNSGRATWVIAQNSDVNDLQSTTSIALTNQYLYGARVRVVFSDAQSVDAVNVVNGFESTVAVSTPAGVGNQLHINQAIKLAINSDAVLNKLLIAEDGPGNTLVIRSLIDGNFRSEDLHVSVLGLDAATYTAYGASQAAEALAAYRFVQGDNSALPGTAGANILEAAARSAANINTNILDEVTPRLGQQAGVNVAGADSTAENANRVNPGAGNDVIVLSTDASSVETIVYTGPDIGNDVIVNFFNDVLDFNSYLTTINATTGARIGTTWANQSVAGSFSTNNVIVTSFNTLNAANATTTLTYTGLTAEQVQGELAATGGFTTAGLDALVGAGVSRKAVLMVENNANAGQYQVFDVTFANPATGGAESWTSVTKLGQVDFGSSLAVATGGVSRTVDGSATPPPTTPPTTPPTVLTPAAQNVAVSATGAVTETATSNTTYTIAPVTSSYIYSIAGFGAGDKIVGPAGVSATVTDQSSFTDGSLSLQFASGGNIVKVTLTGLTAAQDSAIFGAADLNTVFGAGTFA